MSWQSLEYKEDGAWPARGVETRWVQIRIRQWRRMCITTSYVLHPVLGLLFFHHPLVIQRRGARPEHRTRVPPPLIYPRPYYPKALDMVPDAVTPLDLALSSRHWRKLSASVSLNENYAIRSAVRDAFADLRYGSVTEIRTSRFWDETIFLSVTSQHILYLLPIKIILNKVKLSVRKGRWEWARSSDLLSVWLAAATRFDTHLSPSSR
jgi:hypothetical protein